MTDKRSLSGSLRRMDIVEAVLAAPFDIILGGLLGVMIALTGRLYLSGFTFLAMCFAIILAGVLVVSWIMRILDAGTDRMAQKIYQQTADARGDPPLSQEERDLGDVHWALRNLFWICVGLGILLGVLVNPLTILGAN